MARHELGLLARPGDLDVVLLDEDLAARFRDDLTPERQPDAIDGDAVVRQSLSAERAELLA
jgi:hypothetical protein